MNDSTSLKIALISMPWSLLNRPSIQLGTLQGYLKTHSSHTVDSFHPYLHIAKAIGTDAYNRLALSGWAGEALFAPLLFPEKYDDAKKLYCQSQESTTDTRNAPIEFDSFCSEIDATCRKWLKNLDISSYDLVGLTVCFNQLLPSLYLAHLIKTERSNTKIVFGGSSCSGELGRSLVQTFQEVDYAICGEGETSLLTLCSFLGGKKAYLPKNIYSRDNTVSNQLKRDTIPHCDDLDLNELPLPDYQDYFTEMAQVFPASPFIPVLPIEFSRGCWWNKCSFCNLNIQWGGYNYKKSDKIFHETLELSRKHETVQFVFTDNALPPKEADSFFSQTAQQPIDFNFFAEIRPITQPQRLKLFRRGGLTTVQVGIEALSTSLLNKMDKGTTAIENISVMKMCAQYGIEMEGNLIVEFPSTSEREIKETLSNLEFVLPFKPLDTATFFLGYGSPVYNSCKDFSIRAILPHSKNKHLFPKTILQSMNMLLHSYRGDRTKQQKLWSSVRKKIRKWQEFHSTRTNKEPLLSYRDGGTFIIIRQELPTGPVLQHRLRGLSRKIYLACESVVDFEQLHSSFPQVNQSSLIKFINEMCQKRLMFMEGKRILSLAIRNPQATLLP